LGTPITDQPAVQLQDSEHWKGVSAIVIPTGEAADDIRYWKTSSLFLWMLGYEFTGASVADSCCGVFILVWVK
jgi:nucleosome binding factor SPN SPT16 subunit